MTLHRGFRKEANEIVRAARADLGLGASTPLNPWQLATHLDIPVLPMASLVDNATSAVRLFSHVSQSSFSGVTVFDGPRRLIVYNDSHTPGRQASDLSHEISHALLFHQPGPALNNVGCRFWDGGIEEEATWLGGALLVPEEATLSIVRRGVTAEFAALEYGVSPKMINYRIDVSGARTRVARGERARLG